MWLGIYRRDLAIIDPRTELLFAIGHRFGELAREQVPNGILLDTDPKHVDEAVAETRSILAGPWTRPIFEAALQHEDVIVRPDILEPDRWGGWRLVEVKSSTGVRPHHVRDVATQVWVARANGLCISSAVIRHASRRITSPFAPALNAPVLDVDVTHELRNIIRHRPAIAAAARKIVRGPEPHFETGAHCTHPFRCEFRDYCQQRQPSPEQQSGNRR